MLHRVDPDPLACELEPEASQALFWKTMGVQRFTGVGCVEQVSGSAVTAFFVAFCMFNMALTLWQAYNDWELKQNNKDKETK